ncbi:MAG TPA: alpha/beta fold hydrolase, partial [Ktedonobacteraceae bacterium]|nr:alpha/beta fold hydrolase [Ktedonobacteraceae bacterium]
MQKSVRSKSMKEVIARVLGLSFLSAFIFTIAVAIRHFLETPMKLESPLPGEAHYYKWKHGYIYYKVLGETKAPPLLLLHSPALAASSYEMRAILEPLAQYYRVYAPDLIGFGISDRPKIDYSSETYTTLCQDFLTDIVKQPATIVASRMSCNYAVGTVATYPNLCERLVLISPHSLEGKKEQSFRSPVEIPKNILVRAWQVFLQETPAQVLLYPILSTRFALQLLMTQFHSTINENDLEYFYASAHQLGAERAAMALIGGKLERDV